MLFSSVNELAVLWELGQFPYPLWISVVYLSKFLRKINGLVHIKGPKVVLSIHLAESNCWILVTIMSKALQDSTEIQIAEHRKQIPRLSNNQAAQLVTKPEIMIWTCWSWGYKHWREAKAPSLIRCCYKSNVQASSGGNWPSEGTMQLLLSGSSFLSLAYWRCAGMCGRQAKSQGQKSVRERNPDPCSGPGKKAEHTQMGIWPELIQQD